PMLGPAALALWDGPTVATFHAAGESSWRIPAQVLFGFLAARIDLRVAVSEQARRTANIFVPGEYEVIPNGVELPEGVDPGARLVAPSLGNESFGMVITRAFACATPVVASDIPGYREIVTPETGALVTPEDPDALAETVEALLADDAARIERGRAARERAARE